MLITGSCHCGNIAFKLNWQPEPTEIPARACSCTFCQKHGGVWTSCPAGELSIQLKDSTKTSRYTFGTKTAEFHVCSCCGVVPVVTSEIQGQTYAVVNVNALDGTASSLLKHTPVSFEGEEQATRLTRRAKGWIPSVQFTAASDA